MPGESKVFNSNNAREMTKMSLVNEAMYRRNQLEQNVWLTRT